MVKNLVFIGILMFVFLTGFLSFYAIVNFYPEAELPLSIGFVENTSQPGDWINENDIEIFKDKIVINIQNSVLSRYAATGSMLPVLGENANGIKIKPQSPDQINVGDIINYKYGSASVVHRVIEKGEDEKGIYFITKGDNNGGNDGKIYWKDVEYVTVVLIY